MKLLIKNALIVDAEVHNKDYKDIFIEDGIIKQIDKNLDIIDADIIDATKYIVMPGFIDMNCHVCDPGFENKEDIETASRSAISGGFTSITCEPDTMPAIDNKTVLEYILSTTINKSCVNIYPYGSMTKNCKGESMSEIGDMKIAGAVAISDGGHSISNSNLLRSIFKYSKMFDIPVITHCQDENLSDFGVVNEGLMSTILGVKGNPKEAEEIEVSRNIILAENIKCKLHIANITTKGSVQLIREAKNRGVDLTAETSPHYFIFTEELTDEYNTFAKVNPPFRTQEDVDAVIEGIKDGTIDVISSGHMPTTLEAKLTEFDNAEFGISTLETAFSASYTTLVQRKILSLSQLIQKMSYNPSKILKINNKGIIAVGADADIIIIDIEEDYEIDSALFKSKAKFTLFQEQTVRGKVVHAVVRGKKIF